MDGYRYWVERHKLLVDLAEKKEALSELPIEQALARALDLEREFRLKLDALYEQARAVFEPAPDAH